MKLAVAVAAVLAVAALAVVANLLLLGRASAQNDPVGVLSPRAHLPRAPEWTVRPVVRERVERDGADD